MRCFIHIAFCLVDLNDDEINYIHDTNFFRVNISSIETINIINKENNLELKILILFAVCTFIFIINQKRKIKKKKDT